MGDRDRMWEHTKAERRKEYLQALREFQTKEHKARFVNDAKQVLFIQEEKLKRIDLTKAEVKECQDIIKNSQVIINKHQ